MGQQKNAAKGAKPQATTAVKKDQPKAKKGK